MKKCIFITAILLIALTFASCNVNDEIQDNTAVRFTATVGEATAATKTAGTAWEAGDAIANNTGLIDSDLAGMTVTIKGIAPAG